MNYKELYRQLRNPTGRRLVTLKYQGTVETGTRSGKAGGAHRGDFETADAMEEEYARTLESEQNPRKMENYHDLLGLSNLTQGNSQEAVKYYRQANLDPANGVFTRYHPAVALGKSGKKKRKQQKSSLQ